MAEVKSVLGKGLAQISKEITGGQAAVDRVAGGGQQKALAFSLSPKATDAMPDVRAKLNEAAALLPKAVRIRLYDRLTFADLPERIQAIAPAGVEEKTIAGLWDPEQMIIHLSLSTADPLKTLRHEQVHMMRALGLLSEADYQRLVRHAEKIDARKAFKIDATYGETTKAQFKDKAAVEDRLTEETVAHLVADRLSGKPIGGGLDKLLKPVRDFLRKVRDALGLKGLRTVDDVFRTIERGGDAGERMGSGVMFSLDNPEAALGVRLHDADLRIAGVPDGGDGDDRIGAHGDAAEVHRRLDDVGGQKEALPVLAPDRGQKLAVVAVNLRPTRAIGHHQADGGAQQRAQPHRRDEGARAQRQRQRVGAHQLGGAVDVKRGPPVGGTVVEPVDRVKLGRGGGGAGHQPHIHPVRVWAAHLGIGGVCRGRVPRWRIILRQRAVDVGNAHDLCVVDLDGVEHAEGQSHSGAHGVLSVCMAWPLRVTRCSRR